MFNPNTRFQLVDDMLRTLADERYAKRTQVLKDLIREAYLVNHPAPKAGDQDADAAPTPRKKPGRKSAERWAIVDGVYYIKDDDAYHKGWWWFGQAAQGVSIGDRAPPHVAATVAAGDHDDAADIMNNPLWVHRTGDQVRAALADD
jgi:hypothetical protein